MIRKKKFLKFYRKKNFKRKSKLKSHRRFWNVNIFWGSPCEGVIFEGGIYEGTENSFL